MLFKPILNKWNALNLICFSQVICKARRIDLHCCPYFCITLFYLWLLSYFCITFILFVTVYSFSCQRRNRNNNMTNIFIQCHFPTLSLTWLLGNLIKLTVLQEYVEHPTIFTFVLWTYRRDFEMANESHEKNCHFCFEKYFCCFYLLFFTNIVSFSFYLKNNIKRTNGVLFGQKVNR